MRSANSAIACPPEMRRIPYARLKTVVKLAYRVAGHHNGGTAGCLWENARLLVGIRSLARFVAATGARLYKELRRRATRVQAVFNFGGGAYETAYVARWACRGQPG